MEAHRKSAFDIIMTTIITLICVTVAFFIIQDLVAPKEKGLETMMTDSGASGTVNVSVESASRGSVVSYTKLYGDIVTDTDPVTLYSDVSGKVTSILVARGDRVEQGDVIAYVDQSRPGYSYQESPVTSTVAGEVLSISVSVGDTVTTSTSMVSVRTDEDLKLATEVPERYISALESGSTSSFTVAAYPGRTYRPHGGHVRHDRPRDGTSGRCGHGALLRRRHNRRIASRDGRPGRHRTVKGGGDRAIRWREDSNPLRS